MKNKVILAPVVNVMKIKKMDKKWTLCLTAILLIVKIGPTSCSVYDGDEWSEWSEWSSCSRTCDGGVTQQFRRCKSASGCHGVSVKRKMCNMQPCGDSSRDYRGDQCRAFNGIKYDGKRRNWEPIEDPDNPCALVCRVEGTDQIVKLSPKLRDGTRCKMRALHVCVDGKCEAVGCDLKIGSPKKIDACGVCGGDSKSCSSPIYRWDLESSGPCNARCGGGHQPVNVVCRNSLTLEKVDAYFCNSAIKPRLDTQSCNIQPCEPQWETGEWSMCSTTCGGGLKIRKVFCAQEKNGTKIQVAEKLCHHIRRPNNQEPCNPTSCPHWHAGPWSSCSVTCGTGYVTRNVVCRDSANLPSSNCDTRLKPGETKPCEEDECSLPAPTAQVINRSPTKKRRVKTTTTSSDAVGSGISSSSTTTEEIPAEYQMPDIDNDIYVEEGIPREHTLPLIQPYPPMDNAILFDNNALPSEPTFVAGEWGPCSSTCGEGRRTRDVKCKIFLEFSRTIANLPDKECPGPKPSENEPCFSSPCHLGDMGVERLSDVHQAALADSETSGGNIRKTLSVGLPPGMAMQDMTFSWKVLGYSPCSTSCLGGIQEAMIQCVRDYDQRIATPVLCMDKSQPDIATTRTCNDHACPPRWNVTEFGPCSKPCGGGVMTREVSCIHEVTRGNTVIVPNNICPSAVPRTERLCNTVNCPPYWEPGEWGKCSKPCGGGIRTRSIHCKQVSALGQVVELSNGDLHCTSSKPGETKSCNKKSCSKMLKPGSSQGGDGGADEDPEYKEKVTMAVKGRGTVYAGVALRLRCPSGKGMDKGSLIWMKGHEYLKVQPERMELIHKTGVLKIKNTTFSDSGIYTCVYNGRPVSNITLMIKPYSGDRQSKRPRGRTNPHDSTLYADQQEGGVSVPMYHGQIITPNSKFSETGVTSSATASPRNFLLDSFLSSLFFWIRWPSRQRQKQNFPSWDWRNGNNPAQTGMMEDEESSSTFSRSLRLRALQLEQSQHGLENYEIGKEEGLADSRTRHHLRQPTSTPTINEEEDELSKLEKKLLSKGRARLRTGFSTKEVYAADATDDEVDNGEQVRWAVGEWTDYCLDSECFNWNTALKRRQVSCEYPNGTSIPMVSASTLLNPGDNMEQCNPEEKPVEALECYNPKCLGRWHTHSWSFCKVSSCGSPGFRTRILQCLWYGSGRPGGHACHSLPRPIVTKICNGPPCPVPSTPGKVQPNKKNRSNNDNFLHVQHHKRHPHHNNSKEQTRTRISPSASIGNEIFVDYWELYDQDNE